jgi:hypothetical protein
MEESVGVYLEGHDPAAVDKWRKLFGWRMPLP